MLVRIISHLTLLCVQIDLSNNQLCGINICGDGTYTTEGIQAVASAISVSASLTSIDLSYNHLRPEGAKHIAKGIAVSASLTDINLSDNILTNYGQDVSGVQAIADALRFSASLIAADLRRNCLDADTKQELRNAMNDRPSFELNL